MPSSLPVDDEEIREIVEDFLVRLAPKVEEIRAAGDKHDFDGLAEMGHWLKGAAPTVGFEAFAEPAIALEQEAKAGNLEEVWQHINEIGELARRACVSLDANPAGLADCPDDCSSPVIP
jgi:HPt (histidine-containing phosphotransfer) domain-containing protein